MSHTELWYNWNRYIEKPACHYWCGGHTSCRRNRHNRANLTKEAEEQKNIQAKIASRKQEIQQLRTYQRGLYEGLIQNHLSKDEYFTFKEKYEAKIEAISEEIEQLKAGLAIITKQLEQYKIYYFYLK